MSFRLGGPFVGNKNIGRIYFPVYPQAIDGDDSFGLIQDAVGGTRTRFYVVGYYNLIDELDAAETADLAHILGRWGSATIRKQSCPGWSSTRPTMTSPCPAARSSPSLRSPGS